MERLSPEQIAAELRREFPDNPEMWVSHETIYQSIYVQGTGALRREPAVYLRSSWKANLSENVRLVRLVRGTPSSAPRDLLGAELMAPCG